MSRDALAIFLRHALPALTACLLTAPAFAQHGAMTVPRNLDQLTDRASDIVRGTVIETRVEKHPELTALDTVIVTLRVRDTLKGEARGRFTFRQYLWDARDVYDAAGYRKGQDLLLLMIAPSRLGLSSPAGMGQGRFRIVRDQAGREMAINAAGNARLFEGLGDAGKPGAALTARQAALVASHRSGPIAAADLAALIRAFTGNH
ncbi:MAG: hypothetical protein FJ171_08665 [Gammaproteobacteria bacterium]|nr:hypothetical protein [Gammaproteobacteria bacterium]